MVLIFNPLVYNLTIQKFILSISVCLPNSSYNYFFVNQVYSYFLKFSYVTKPCLLCVQKWKLKTHYQVISLSKWIFNRFCKKKRERDKFEKKKIKYIKQRKSFTFPFVIFHFLCVCDCVSFVIYAWRSFYNNKDLLCFLCCLGEL